MRVALYVRVSTVEQHTQNQSDELCRYVATRGWTLSEAHVYADAGVSGAKESRPALDRMLKDARRRQFDIVAVWRLDRLGGNLRHLITTIDQLTALGIGFVSLGEALDATTPAGRLMTALLASFAQFERERIRERVFAGIARGRASGKRLGRPISAVPVERLAAVAHLPYGRAAHALGVSKTTLKDWRRKVRGRGCEAKQEHAVVAKQGSDNPPSRRRRKSRTYLRLSPGASRGQLINRLSASLFGVSGYERMPRMTSTKTKKIKQLPITGIRIEPELLAKLKEIRDETGAPINAQVRIALIAYLEHKGELPAGSKAIRKS